MRAIHARIDASDDETPNGASGTFGVWLLGQPRLGYACPGRCLPSPPTTPLPRLDARSSCQRGIRLPL